jgi:hypothetical protein
MTSCQTTPTQLEAAGMPSLDIAHQLARLVGSAGAVQNFMGGFRIRIYQTAAFPFDAIFKTLLSRNYQVYVTDANRAYSLEAKPRL